MYSAKITAFIFILTSFLIHTSGQSIGDYRTNNTGTWNWTTAANWQRCEAAGTWVGASNTTYPGQNPGAGTITIQDNTIVTLNNNITNNIGALTIVTGTNISYVNIQGSGVLTVSGTTTISANSNNDYKYIVVAGNFTTGSLNLTGSGNTQDAYLEVSSGTATVTGNITMNGGDGRRNYILFSGAGTLNLGGGFVTNGFITSTAGGGNPPAAPTSGTINYYNAAQTVWGNTYYNLTLSGSGIKTTAGVSVNGRLSMEGTATASAAITYGATATIRYLGSAAQVTGPEFPANLTISGVFIENSSGVSLNAAKNMNGTGLTIGASVSNSEFNDGGYQLTCTGALNLVSGTFKLGSATAATTWPAFGTNTLAAGTTVQYISGVAQTVSRTPTYRNLTFTGAGIKTIQAGTLNIAEEWRTDGGNVAMNTNNSSATVGTNITGGGSITSGTGTISVAGNFSNTGTFTCGTGTVIYNGTDQQVKGATYYNLTISNGGTKTLQTAATVNRTLTLNSGVLQLGNNNLYINYDAVNAITGAAYSISNMIATDGTGYVIKNAASLQTLYPIGGGGYYSPVTLVITSGSGGTVNARAVASNSLGTGFIPKYWDVLCSSGPKTFTATFTYSASEGGPPKSAWFKNAGAWQTPPPSGAVTLGTYAVTVTSTTSITTTSTLWSIGIPNVYYSYQPGSWNDVSTWTSDPGGTTQVGNTVPGNSDYVVILSGRTVTLPTNIATTGLNVTINEGGVLDLDIYRFIAALQELNGQGTLRLASANFPSVTSNTFVNTGGGTTEYVNSADFALSATQSFYNNLLINLPNGIVATQLSNITLNGNLQVKQGTFRINNNSATTKLNLVVNGNVAVNAGAFITVGNGSTNTTTTPTGITGGTAPFLNYYENFHRVVIYGDFTNQGTVRFTNLDYPIYNSFPPLGSVITSGAASVYFMGTSDNSLICNGITDFYNLILDKGTDQTYSLTVQPSAYSYFRIFGANISGGDITNPVTTAPYPNLKKALWIRTGTLILKGLTIIPSLTEGETTGSPASDFIVPTNGALVLDGPDVIVLSTADNYGEVNRAYGVAGGTGSVNGVNTNATTNFQGLLVYGKLVINDGYLSTRESSGLLYNNVSAGQIEINGGIVDAKQFRENGTTGSGASFLQTGGLLILRGRFVRPADFASINDLTSVSGTLNTRAANGTNGGYGTFNINNASNVFSMSGGNVRIYDACTTGSVNIVNIISSSANTNVTGGTFEVIPITGSVLADATSHLIYSVAAPLGNLTINQGTGCATTVSLNTFPISILKNLTLVSGSFIANNLNVSVGGNFTVSTGTTYNSGTNTTILEGTGNQIFTISGTVNNGSPGLNNLTLSNTADTIKLAGSQGSLFVQGVFNLNTGTFDDGGKTVNVAGNLVNSGKHIGSGLIRLSSTAVQTIGGNGNGIFNNIELNNTNAATAPVSLIANTTITGNLTFSQDKAIDIKTYNLRLSALASIVNAGSTANRYIKTSGNVGDGGLTREFSSVSTFIFPVGVTSNTPASIGFGSAPSSYGSITVIPVNYAHPNVTFAGRSLSYFWRVKSSGFTLGTATVNHGYTYNQANVITGAGITENEYVAARYNLSNFTWTSGTFTDVDETNNIIGEPGPGNFLQGVSFIDGDYTAGDNNTTNPFGVPLVFYSRINGAAAGNGLWSNANNWSYTSNTGTANTGGLVPGINDIVVIGGNDSIFLDRDRTDPWTTNNVDPRSCASLQIERGSALDMGYNTNCVFSMVISHPNGNGNFRITTSSASGTTFTFPAGDFSDFNQNLGTTELYTTNPDPGTTYWLPSNVSTYGNLILSPLGGSNIIFGNTNLVIYGNLTTRGQNSESWYCPTWNSDYPTAPFARAAKTITINGSFYLQGGALIFYGNNALAQNFIIQGDVIVNQNSGIMVYGNATNQSMQIGRNLINNAAFGTGVNLYRGCNFNLLPLTFFGNNNGSISNTSGTPNTTVQNVTINKGNSQITTLTIDIGGTLTTPNDNWLTLLNGTLRYMRTNPAEDFTISKNTQFVIPATAGLFIDYSNTANVNILLANCDVTPTDANDLILNGKFTLARGNVFVGPINGTVVRNNDIEYSGGGASEIDIQGGNLTINGQIRRNPAISHGILKYVQSAGAVIINGQNAITTNAKFEILNDESIFNMSGGTITIVRGGGGTSFGDFFIRPGTSSVTGGTILFAHNLSGSAQSYRFDANVPLNNLVITGRTAAAAANAQVNLMVNPLVLNGSLSLSNANSILNTNNINVTVKGDFTNDGTPASYIYGTNLTTFNGDIQNLNGSSITNFYNLLISPVTSLTLFHNTSVSNNLELAYGTLVCGNYAVNLERDLINNATYTGTLYGIILNGTSGQQKISGTGTFGRLELNNLDGARTYNPITLNNDLVLTLGIFDINRYMLTLGQNSNIGGTGFNSLKMISTDGVFSDVGITKVFGTGATTFNYPIGVSGKYTPAVLTITANSTVGSIRVNNINSQHPAVIDPNNVLQYFWEVESSGITGFSGNLVLHYLASDVKGGPESNYVEARLIIPGTSWQKGATGADMVDEINHSITFNYAAGTSNLNGEYTAGNDPAIPDEVPVFTSNADGNWNDPSIWTQTAGDPYTLTGGPNGFIVIIDHVVDANADFCQAYRTTINEKLRLILPFYGHNFGTVDGSGTLYLESGLFPAGRYTSFFDCAGNSTLEYGGSGSYIMNADLFDEIPNLLFTGLGTRILPNKDLTICHILNINGPALDNATYNRKLTILGSMLRTVGSFSSGTGASATVRFAGASAQTLGNFTGGNGFNNIEIDNPAGLTLNGSVSLGGNLLLTDGIITTSAVNKFTITNASVNCVFPTGGSASSYISGPLTKTLNQGDTYFKYPLGNASTVGNKLSLKATQTGTLDWTVEYINPSSFNTVVSPLTAVNEVEYWNVSTPTGGQAIVQIEWDPASNLTPLMTQNGISDMRVAEYNGTNWIELASTMSGDNYNGYAETSSRATVASGGSKNFTLACINTPKPRIRLAPTGPICGSAGIPITLSSSYTIYSTFTVEYTIDGVAQTPLTPASFPATLPTLSTGGTYQLTSFKYNRPAGTERTGVVDITSVITYAVPTTANAGGDQSLCGATSATLAGNAPVTGNGLWSITSGTGGTISVPASPSSGFSGTNGTTYVLRWTISNGTCTSSDNVTISFPLLAAQPSNFTSSSGSVCQGQFNIPYIVPNDPSVSYTWSYTGTGYTIHGTGNSISVDFDQTSTSGLLSVTASNTCGSSAPRSINVTVNPIPTITLDPTMAETCQGINYAELSYTATNNSPNQYSIVYGAGALAQGFADVNNSALGTSPVNLVVPIAALVNDYSGNLTVRNSTTGCVSADNAFTVRIHPLPVPTLSGTDTTCAGSLELYETESGMTNYIWSVTPGSGSISPPGNTYQITVDWSDIVGQFQDRIISVEYTNANGCTASSATQLSVRVFHLPVTGPTHYIPNGFNH